MRKRFLIIAALLLGVGIGVTAFFYWHTGPEEMAAPTNQEVVELQQRLGQTNAPVPPTPEPLDLAQPVRLAVGGLGLPDNDRNQQLGDLITADLTSASGLVLVERRELNTILGELNLSLSGLVRASDAVRAGKLLGARWFLLGTEAKVNGTNFLLARLVDARTGILRDADIFPGDEPFVKLAADLAGFVWQSRQAAATVRPRIYLAIGGFKDLSLNNRQAEFPAQLRTYLTTAYQGSDVTLLEREAVDLLLQEVRLDLAGLTATDGTNPPSPMLSAYWLVDGEYQSYETTNFQVEVELWLGQMFGRQSVERFRGPPDTALFGQIKHTIDRAMEQNAQPVLVSRLTEARAQLGEGKSILSLSDLQSLMPVWVDYYPELKPGQAARLQRNTEAAIHAFETVLMLEPTNREARIYLGYCLRIPGINRADDARNYYREILEAPVQDKWSRLAQLGLENSFQWSPTGDKARWFGTAAAETTSNTPAAAFYREQAEAAAKAIIVQENNSPKALQLAEERLLAGLRDAENVVHGRSGGISYNYGMADFVSAMKTGNTNPAQLLTGLLPRMETEFPDLKPSLLAAVAACQTDTNAPVIAEFQTALDEVVQHPDRLVNVERFWWDARWSLYDWCFAKKDYALAIQFLEGEQATDRQGHPGLFDNMEKIKLAYACLAARQWQKALDIFNSFGGQPVEASGDGPWGRAFAPVLTDKMAAYCREKINPGSGGNAPRFILEDRSFGLCSPAAFAVDDRGLWVAIAGQLLRLDLDLRTNLVIALPKPPDVPITAMQVGDAKIWIATAGAGLIEFDRSTRQCKCFTEADGLLMNELLSLQVDGDSLWIGYGEASRGGLGRFDLTSHQSRSFMASMDGMVNSSVSGDQIPPAGGVLKIMPAEPGLWWMQTGDGIRQFDATRGSWKNFPAQPSHRITCFTAQAGWLAAGTSSMLTEYYLEKAVNNPGQVAVASRSPNGLVAQGNGSSSSVYLQPSRPGAQKKTLLATTDELNGFIEANPGWYVTGTGGGRAMDSREGGLYLHSSATGQWHYFANAAALPSPPTAVELDGQNLWVGGEGYLSLMDPAKNKIRKLCDIPARAVNHIQIGGGYVWVEYDEHLHRAALGQLP